MDIQQSYMIIKDLYRTIIPLLKIIELEIQNIKKYIQKMKG